LGELVFFWKRSKKLKEKVNLLREKKDNSSADYVSFRDDKEVRKKPFRKLKEEIEKKWCVNNRNSNEGQLSLPDHKKNIPS
jgi:hypothetical protein